MADLSALPPAIGIIGGSGLYDIDGFSDREEIEMDTPFGPPSDKIIGGTLAGRRVFFLPRHGKGHRILPTELNHRANIWALRSLNVRWIIAVTAVGSLKEEYQPRDVVLPDQFFDRTSRREHHTFFGRGIVAHVSFADPISTGLRTLLAKESRAAGAGYGSTSVAGSRAGQSSTGPKRGPWVQEQAERTAAELSYQEPPRSTR